MTLPILQVPADEVQHLLSWLTGLGGFSVFVIFGWLVATGRLVLRREIDRERGLLREMETERNQWRQAALRNTEMTERSQVLTAKAIELAGTTNQGPPGTQGERGLQGFAGERGASGSTGPRGEHG